MASWTQALLRLTAAEVDYNDRFDVTCATGRCWRLPTHATRWDYVTGQGGRIGQTTRQVCDVHAGKFAAKHDLVAQDAPAEPESAFAAAAAALTGDDAPIDSVCVYKTYSRQWYLQFRRSTSRSLLSTSNLWLAGVTGDADLAAAIDEANAALAWAYHRLVPVAPWQRTGDTEAVVPVLPAERSPAWACEPWLMTVTCGPDPAWKQDHVWKLTRTLDGCFLPLVDDLGFHNMDLERALRCANDLLDRQGWTGIGVWGYTGPDVTVARRGWHPDQVDAVAEEVRS